MSVLDTFFLLFEADATELDKALDKSRRKGKETADDLRAVDLAARKLGQGLGDQLKQLGGALFAAVAVGAMSQAMMDAANHADQLDEKAKRLKLTVEDLSLWGDMVKREGGSAESFAAGIDAFNKQLGQMEATGKSRAAPFLKELGIDLEAAANKGKSAVDFLPQLADAFAKLDPAKALALGSRLGLDQATIMTLQAGRREVEALQARMRELGVVTKEQGEIAAKFNDQQDDTKHAFRSLWLEVASKVLPALTWVSEKFEQVARFMRKHSDFIVGLMIALGAAVSAFVLPALIKMGVAAVVAFAPFLMLGAIVAGLSVAFALLYDDVVNFMEGNDSMIGQIVTRWPIIGEMAKAVAGWLRFLWDVAAALLQFLVTMWTGPGEAWDAFVANIVDGVERLMEMFPSLGATLRDVAEWFGKVWDLAGEVGTMVGGALGSMFNGGNAGLAGAIQAGQQQLGLAGASSVGSVTSSAISNTTRGGDRRVTIGEVKVQTQATDAQGISRSIGGALNSQMRQASSQLDDGVAA